MIKVIQILILLILFIISYFSYLIFFDRDDKLAYIYTADDIIEYYENNGNNITNTQYNDRGYALEFLDSCYELTSIKDLSSESFMNFSNIKNLKEYMSINNISDPQDCINGTTIGNSSLKKDCIFYGDDGLHNPYIAGLLNETITIARFKNAMNSLTNFYKNTYPSNAYILEALGQKSLGIDIDIEYCNDLLRNNIEYFIKPFDKNK